MSLGVEGRLTLLGRHSGTLVGGPVGVAVVPHVVLVDVCPGGQRPQGVPGALGAAGRPHRPPVLRHRRAQAEAAAEQEEELEKKRCLHLFNAPTNTDTHTNTHPEVLAPVGPH